MTLSPDELSGLIEDLESIRRDMIALVQECDEVVRAVHPDQRASARNLLHYLALRGRDLRPLQARLAAAGLSSLGRAESHTLSAVDAVLGVLYQLSGQSAPEREPDGHPVDLADGQRLLEAHSAATFGPRPPRGAAIMVTMPSEAADDYTLVAQLVQQGMDCIRINCAHDTVATWTRMVEHMRRAAAQAGRPCRLLMDLAGPKIRTGAIAPGPAVVKIRPQRDTRGSVTEPAHVWLTAQEEPSRPPTPASATIPVPAVWLAQLAPGDRIAFVDARGARRRWTVLAVGADGCWAESRKTCYLETGTALRVDRGDGTLETRVGAVAAPDAVIHLSRGDELFLTRPHLPGRDAVRDSRGRVLTPASIGCTEERIFEDVRAGDQVFFDDGRIGGVVERIERDCIRVRITQTRARGAKLRAEKGVNLPDTSLRVAALTAKDREDLEFVRGHADMVALSFVNSVEDVRALRELLGDAPQLPAIVLKIETRRGFENLPAMLLEVMRVPRCAVMIARGDLAVESGFERMAEVQEEILWLCEAAHVPVIWATQVLESLAKEGQPSRAEITDAAMSHRAECVMLNKGPFIVQAVRALDDILVRMRGHQMKKRPMLRPLHLAATFKHTMTGHLAAPAGSTSDTAETAAETTSA